MIPSLSQLKALINKVALAALFFIFFAESAVSTEHDICIIGVVSKPTVHLANLERGDGRTADLGFIRINCTNLDGYTITFSSLNNGKLVNNQGANFVIGYDTLFTTDSGRESHDFAANGPFEHASGVASALPDGDPVSISIELIPWNFPIAGLYSDIINISVSSKD